MIRAGLTDWEFTEQYGWVNNEDDAAMLTEAELLDHIVRLNAMLFELSNALERAYCRGEGFHPDYGWPIGDLTPDVMADEIIKRTKENR
jgi:glutamine synthetase adenylyltransferase